MTTSTPRASEQVVAITTTRSDVRVKEVPVLSLHLARVVLAGTLVLFATACGGGGDGPSEVGTGQPVGAASEDPRFRSSQCLTAMIDSLVAAFRASDGAKDPDQAFADAAGKLPAPCRLLDAELLKALLDQATQEAIVLTTGPDTQPR
ncbi:MAG: hypothetical protein ACT4PP_12410 [Sporichthyaceae bacterium]